MPIADFAELLNQTVTVKALSSRDSYGKPTYGAGTSYSARVSFKARLIRGADDRLHQARGEVWLQSNVAVALDDQITLPDGTTPPILAVERAADEDGTVHHTKIIFG